MSLAVKQINFFAPGSLEVCRRLHGVKISILIPIYCSVDDYEQKFGDIGREMFYKVMRPSAHMPMMK